MEGRGRRSQRLLLLNEPKHAGPAESAGGQGKPSSVMPRADKPSPPGRETPALLAAVLPLEKINTLKKKKICPRCWEIPGTQHQRGLAKQKNHLVAITSFPPPTPSWPSFLTHAYTSSRVCPDALRSTHPHTCMRSLFHPSTHIPTHIFTHTDTCPPTFVHTPTLTRGHNCAPSYRNLCARTSSHKAHVLTHARNIFSHMHASTNILCAHTFMHKQRPSILTHVRPLVCAHTPSHISASSHTNTHVGTHFHTATCSRMQHTKVHTHMHIPGHKHTRILT